MWIAAEELTLEPDRYPDADFSLEAKSVEITLSLQRTVREALKR